MRLRSATCLFIVGLLTACGEWVEDDVEVGLQGEARTNPLLMVDMWADAMGLESSTTQDFPRELTERSIVVTPASEWAAPSAETARVLDWVDGGGHLVMCVFGYDEFAETLWEMTELSGDVDPSSALAGFLGRQPILAELGVELEEEATDRDEVEVDG